MGDTSRSGSGGAGDGAASSTTFKGFGAGDQPSTFAVTPEEAGKPLSEENISQRFKDFKENIQDKAPTNKNFVHDGERITMSKEKYDLTGDQQAGSRRMRLGNEFVNGDKGDLTTARVQQFVNQRAADSPRLRREYGFTMGKLLLETSKQEVGQALA